MKKSIPFLEFHTAIQTGVFTWTGMTLLLLAMSVSDSFGQCPNLISNPGFESGNTDFSCQFTYQSNLTPANTYYVGYNANTYHPSFSGVAHTGSNMMIANGTDNNNSLAIVYQTNVNNVVPNLTYTFSMWCREVYDGSDPTLRVYINDVYIYSATFGFAWANFAFNWTAPAGITSANIKIREYSVGSNNDYALDDLSFTISDNTAPTHDAVSVNDNCWVTNGTNTYTISLISTESQSGFGGPYGMMALINYNLGEPNAGGYFAWHPTAYVHTNDQMACTGGGYVSKAATWGGSRITLVSASTSLNGNQRTVNFVVRPSTSFIELNGTNKISMYTSDNCNNQRGWTLFDVNFTTRKDPLTLTAGNSGPICAGNTVNLTASGLAPAGQVINFSTGTFSYINVPHSSAYTLSTNSTIEAWIYPTSFTGLMIIYNKENSYEAEINTNGTIEWAYSNTSPGWAWINTGYTVTLNTWTHVAFVYDYTNSQFRTYVNGSLVHTYTISGTVADPGDPFRIGNRSSNSPFYGRIDNVRIWNVARTISQINNSMFLENPVVATNLVALYPLNGNANATVGTNGSLVNGGGVSWIVPTYYTYTWTGTNAPAPSTSQTQTTGALNTGGTYPYTVKASAGGCTEATSGSTTVTVNALPAITGQPASPAAVCTGTGAPSFTVTATGAGLTYQWQESTNGGGAWNTISSCTGIYSGCTSPTLTLTNPTAGMNGYKYRCVVTGTCSPAATTDGNATLTVNPTPAFNAAVNSNISCYGGSDGKINITMTSTNHSLYTFSRNNGTDGYLQSFTGSYPNFTLTGLPEGVHKIRIKDNLGCVSPICP